MLFTPLQNLPCLSNEDYSAWALYMKCLGLQVDETLAQQMASFESVRNRPTAVWTSSSVQTNIFDGSFLSVFEVAFSANWPGAVPTSPTVGNLRGWWMVGLNVNLISSGAVTINTYRRIDLTISPPIGAPSSTPETVFTDNTWESNTANGENLLAAGTLYTTGSDSPSNSAGGAIFTAVHHNNAVSLNTTLTPAPTIWATYLGDTPEIQAVS